MSALSEADVVLRDGSTAHLREPGPDDVRPLRQFLGELSERSRWFRFFSAASDLDPMARWSAGDDDMGGRAVVATSGPAGDIVGQGRYVPWGGDMAEVAFAVADAWQRHGIATILLAYLANAADDEGIATLTATVLPANRQMIGVFRESGFPVEVRSRPGLLEVTLPTALTPEARAAFEARDRIAAAEAVRTILRPSSVALVGASDRPGSVGQALLRNLVDGFRGDLHLVSPRGGTIAGRPAHPSVLAVPASVELAVIAVPAAAVLDVARECATKGVRALVVVTAGFGEGDAAGRARQSELLAICRSAGMRLVGPNCLGVLCTANDVRLNATFAPQRPTPGRIAFASQSGAFGIAALEEAAGRGLGMSSFASMGNKADLSGNDFLAYWDTDPATDVVLLYLESFGNPRKFGRLARRLAEHKPIVAVKSGRSPAGQRAAASHTGALVAASDATVDALFRHAGVIRADTMGELFDVAGLLAHQPLPAGDGVGIVTNVGGPGIVCADACAANGLRVATFAGATREQLADRLSPNASVVNPVDMIASASAEDYEHAILTVAADPSVDAVIAIFIQPLATGTDEVAAAVRRAATAPETVSVPILGVFMHRGEPPPELAGDGVRVPAYRSTEDAVRALAHAVGHACRRAEPPSAPPAVDPGAVDAGAAIVARALARGEGWLPPSDVAGLLAAHGIGQVRAVTVGSARAAGRAAAELDGAVALKAVAPGVLHKTEAGAVALDLRGPAAAARAARRMAAALKAEGPKVDGFVVQAMAHEGVELLVGVTSDARFGPVVACGAGGVAAELLADVAVRLAPVDAREAEEMIRGLRTFPLLDGFRGAPPIDVAAVADVVVRTSGLAAAHPAVVELDLNPVIASAAGAVVVDARIRVEPPPPAPSFPAVGV
jgi:acetyl coenzyme A synthetase (ADP forming)-like protein